MKYCKINFIFIFLILLLSCKEDELEPKALLNVNVVNTEGDPIALAKIKIYQNEPDFLNENAPVFIGETDSSGTILISNLTVQHSYYIDITKGNLSNWITETYIEGLIEGTHEFSTVILENWYSNLCNVSGKSWSPKYVLDNGIWYNFYPCTSDDQYIFYKNFDMNFRNNSKCNDYEYSFFTGDWSSSGLSLTYYSDIDNDPGTSLALIETNPDYFVGNLTRRGVIIYYERN